MTLTEKIVRLQEAAGSPSLANFADLVGVKTVTLRRVGKRGNATDRILKRLAGPFEDITLEMLRDPNVDLSANLCLRPAHVKTSDTDDYHEGRQLGAYLDKLGRGSRADLAAKMGVSRPQVNSYENTERFQTEVRATLRAALGVSDEVIFTRRRLSRLEHPNNSSSVPNFSLLGLPLLRPDERRVDPNTLIDYMNGFSSVVQPNRTYYVNMSPLAQSPIDLSHALVLLVTEADHMDPVLRPGAFVLALQVEPANWLDVYDGSVAILVNNKLTVRRVYRNDLRTNNLIEVGTYDRSSSMTLRREDIQMLFQVTHILLSPA